MAQTNRYQNFAELAANEKAGVDYRIELLDRSSSVTVFAIHGGKIEYGTSRIARAIAGESLNLYLFEGLKASGNFRNLHISSHQYDEPQAVALVKRSRVCITIHGFKERNRNWVGIGGRNEKLKHKIFDALRATGLIEQDEMNPVKRLQGMDPMNIVNRAMEAGVQLEISYRLRRLLGLYPNHLELFTKAIRDAIKND